jgi:hypothetical protein
LNEPECDVQQAIDRFLAEKLMVEMDGQVASLAVFRNRAPDLITLA